MEQKYFYHKTKRCKGQKKEVACLEIYLHLNVNAVVLITVSLNIRNNKIPIYILLIMLDAFSQLALLPPFSKKEPPMAATLSKAANSVFNLYWVISNNSA